MPLLALVAACSTEERTPAPYWVSLSRFHEEAELLEPSVEEPWSPPVGGGERLTLRFEGDEDDPGAWATVVLDADDWERHDSFPDTWHLLRPLVEEGSPGGDSPPQRLDGFEYAPFTAAVLRHPEDVEANTFCGYLDQLYLKLPPGAAPPADLRYSVWLDRGRRADDGWRVSVGRFQVDGVPAWPGRRAATVEVGVPSGSVLRFATLAVANGARGRDDTTLAFRVRADGEVVFEHRQRLTDQPTFERHSVAVPEGERVRFELETEGPAALAAFANPLIGPAEIGEPGARPWDEDRRDVILFLADTFRADNLAAYGGEHGVTPRLDALAERGVLFRRAWSPAPWTLPAQASMMTGLLPYQHAATEILSALPDDALTVAEHLHDEGYRTAAVTDAAFLSHRYAMDQGFEWFDEIPDDKRVGGERDPLDFTLARVDELLEADDGRPLFLWVQTYRVHFPYVVSDETREAWGDRLDLSLHWKDVEAATREGGWVNGEPMPEALRPVTGVMHDLYLGGVADLDRIFGRWVRRHAERLEHTALVFTSDHGEAFGEHDDLYHGGGVWEAQVRVPLFLHGAGLEPRVVDHAASLVDLPRTIAALAGVDPVPRWGGESLLSLEEDRPVFAFESTTYPNAAQAIVEGDRKLILRDTEAALRDGAVREAYDLAADPAEARNAVGEEGEPPAWVEAMRDRLAPRALDLRVPLLEPSTVELTPDDKDELEKMGYTGDEDD